MSSVARGRADSPEVSKRKLRSALRQAREKAGLTQKAVAEQLYWSQSKVIRIEQGNVPFQPTDVQALLIAYGVDAERIADFVELAKASRQPDEWVAYKDLYSAEALTLFAYEQAAKVIQKYEPSVIPGLFQTEDYARALLTGVGYSPDRVKRTLESRLRRQELLETSDGPDLDFIVGEAAVSRPVGGAGVMREQVTRLKELAGPAFPRVTVRMVPFSVGIHPGFGSAFTLLQFADHDLRDLVYLEGVDKESLARDDPDSIDSYGERFVALTEIAVVEDKLEALLDEVVAYRFR